MLISSCGTCRLLEPCSWDNRCQGVELLQERLEGEETTGGRAVKGSRIQRTKTFRPGRVCAESGCGTSLSIYNNSGYCSLHTPELPRI